MGSISSYITQPLDLFGNGLYPSCYNHLPTSWDIIWSLIIASPCSHLVQLHVPFNFHHFRGRFLTVAWRNRRTPVWPTATLWRRSTFARRCGEGNVGHARCNKADPEVVVSQHLWNIPHGAWWWKVRTSGFFRWKPLRFWVAPEATFVYQLVTMRSVGLIVAITLHQVVGFSFQPWRYFEI